MIVGTVEIRLHLPDARTLKDKRSVLRGLKERLRRKFNVSVAEVEDHDVIRSATIAVAQVGNDSRYINGTLDKVIGALRYQPGASLVDYTVELF